MQEEILRLGQGGLGGLGCRGLRFRVWRTRRDSQGCFSGLNINPNPPSTYYYIVSTWRVRVISEPLTLGARALRLFWGFMQEEILGCSGEAQLSSRGILL